MKMNLEEALKKVIRSQDHWPLINFNFRNGAKGTLPPPVSALADDLGFSVKVVPLDRDMKGRLVPDANAPRGFGIEVNKWSFIEERRLACLHEMAHGLIHMDERDAMPNEMYFDETSLEYDSKFDIREREANEFVAALCFGHLALRTALAIKGRDIPKLGRFFGLPRSFVQEALRDLSSYDR